MHIEQQRTPEFQLLPRLFYWFHWQQRENVVFRDLVWVGIRAKCHSQDVSRKSKKTNRKQSNLWELRYGESTLAYKKRA
jgi:hypothetical protein